MTQDEDQETKIGLWVVMGVVFAVLLGVIGLAVSKVNGAKTAKTAQPMAAASATVLAAAPAGSSLAATAASSGAAATARGPKPVSLYFDTAKADAPGGATQEIKALVDYAIQNPNAKLALSGFHDSRGDAAKNAELAKNRAKSVRELLKAAGVPEDRVMMQKPVQVDGGSNDKESRRVDIYVLQ